MSPPRRGVPQLLLRITACPWELLAGAHLGGTVLPQQQMVGSRVGSRAPGGTRCSSTGTIYYMI